jgi:hypothetical protein
VKHSDKTKARKKGEKVLKRFEQAGKLASEAGNLINEEMSNLS